MESISLILILSFGLMSMIESKNHKEKSFTHSILMASATICFVVVPLALFLN